jgi:plasmid stability protein
MVLVKTTLEIPEPLFRQLKVSAAKQGKTIRAVVNEALTEKLSRSQHGVEDVPAWRVAFGGLRRLRDETSKINQDLATEFSRVNQEEWK